jgi:hypothetical protein
MLLIDVATGVRSLAKHKVAGSTPVTRSRNSRKVGRFVQPPAPSDPRLLLDAFKDDELPQELRAALADLAAHRDDLNGWYAHVADRPGGVTTDWQALAVLDEPNEREIDVVLALRKFRAGREDARTVLAAISACRRAYVAVIARGVPQPTARARSRW